MSFMTLLDERPTTGEAAPRARVRIRPYESADGELVRAMSARLSSGSLYQRFFAGTPALPPKFLDALAKTDHHDREVLLALGPGPPGSGTWRGDASGGDVVIGIAEYVRDARVPDRADLAVLVADAWHRRGVGRRLVTELAARAGRNGIAHFGADVLVTNRSALAAIAGLWPAARGARDGTTAGFTLPVRALLSPAATACRDHAIGPAPSRGVPAGDATADPTVAPAE